MTTRKITAFLTHPSHVAGTRTEAGRQAHGLAGGCVRKDASKYTIALFAVPEQSAEGVVVVVVLWMLSALVVSAPVAADSAWHSERPRLADGVFLLARSQSRWRELLDQVGRVQACICRDEPRKLAQRWLFATPLGRQLPQVSRAHAGAGREFDPLFLAQR